jgi:anti-anti-sigma regulatory factor
MIIQTRGDVIKLRGALTENQWPAIKSAVSLLLDQHPRGVVIDADGLTEVTEAGTRTFMDASNFIQAHNARVVVAGLPDDMLTEIRKIPGVRSQLVVAKSVDEARASLEAGGAAVLEERAKPAVLVPLIGAWPKAIEYGAIEAVSRRTDLHLLYVLQIPRNLPLGVPIPEKEQEADQALSEAETMLKRKGVRIRKLATRARDIIEGVGRFAAESKPELLIVAYSKEELAKDSSRFSVVSILCHEAPCDVAFICATR